MNTTTNFITNYLFKLGLTREEATIFTSILEKGQATILQISRDTGIERTKIYGVVEKLRKKEILIESIEFRKRYLKTCDFSKLEFLLAEKVESTKELEQSFRVFKSQIEAIKATYNPTSVNFYRGVDGIKQMLWNELDMKEKKLLSFTYRHLGELLGMKFAKKLSKEYSTRRITLLDLQSSEYIRSKAEKKLPSIFNTISRYIEPGVLDTPIAVDIYDNTVALFNWHKGEVFGAEIHSDKFADFMKQMFMIVWKMSSKKKAM